MYNVVFVNDNGSKYFFGINGTTIFDMDLGSGMSTKINASQGFSQIGETMQSRTVSGRTINVTGTVYGNIPERKKAMRKILSPFSCGRLIFENQYYIRVCVKSAPSFSSVKNNGKFTMQLFAPYPFFKSINETIAEIGLLRPLFSFPVNYAVPHKFGEKSATRYINIYNDSDVNVTFALRLSASGISTNPVIANLQTFKMLKLNGSLESGDVLEIYRDEENVLNAELTSNGIKTDAISWIDESSTLFELEVGDNLISVIDDNGGANLSAQIIYNPTVVAVYES